MFWVDSVRNSSLYRFLAINVFSLSLVAAAYHKGWVQSVYLNDSTHVTTAMAVLFFIGLLLSTKKVFELNRVANRLGDFINRNFTYNSLIHRGVANIKVVKHISIMMFLLGITGTVAGLKIAFTGVDPEAAQVVSKVGPMVTTLIHGMSIKLDSTLMGLLLYMWTASNFVILSNETDKIIAKVCEQKGI